MGNFLLSPNTPLPPPHISFNAVSPLFFSSSHRCAVDSEIGSPPFLSPRHDHLSANCGAIVFRGSAGRRRRRRRGFGAQRTHAPFRGCSHSRRGGREKSLNLKPKPPTFPSPSSSRWGSKSVWENVCKEEGAKREKNKSIFKSTSFARPFFGRRLSGEEGERGGGV